MLNTIFVYRDKYNQEVSQTQPTIAKQEPLKYTPHFPSHTLTVPQLITRYCQHLAASLSCVPESAFLAPNGILPREDEAEE